MTSTAAYAARAREYADLLGTIEAMAPADRTRIEAWAADAEGPLLDAGCGPGHWTAHLSALGHDVHGIDPVPEFIEIARRTHPQASYAVGSFADLAQDRAHWGGILAWYSLIHLPPCDVPDMLATLRAALRPTGLLLLGFFDGARQERFEHAVAPAQFWPAEKLVALLEQAGFEVLDVEQRQDPGARAHAAISARSA